MPSNVVRQGIWENLRIDKGGVWLLWRFDPTCGVSTQPGSFGYN